MDSGPARTMWPSHLRRLTYRKPIQNSWTSVTNDLCIVKGGENVKWDYILRKRQRFFEELRVFFGSL